MIRFLSQKFSSSFRSYAKANSGENTKPSKSKSNTKTKTKTTEKPSKKIKSISVPKKEYKKLAVILTQNVPQVGEKGEEIRVLKGFSRNYLFPKKYAVIATKETRDEYAPFREVFNI